MNDVMVPPNVSTGKDEANSESNVDAQNALGSIPASDEHTVVRSDTASQPNITHAEGTDYVGPEKVIDVDFTYPTHTDPQRYIDGHSYGVYLDDEQRKAGEIQRAKIEGREPDLENPPAVQGTPLIPTAVMKSQVPGDYVVEPDVTLGVTVGVREENLAGFGDAIHARKVNDANNNGKSDAKDSE